MASKKDICNVVHACAVLHNMLLQFDGYDKLWTAEDWLTLDPTDSDEEAEDAAAKKRRLIPPERLQEYVIPTNESDGPKIVEAQHYVLRAKLITNLNKLWDRGEVEHLRFPKKVAS